MLQYNFKRVFLNSFLYIHDLRRKRGNWENTVVFLTQKSRFYMPSASYSFSLSRISFQHTRNSATILLWLHRGYVWAFLIKIGRRFFFSHIYARRVLYASRVSKRESVKEKKEFAYLEYFCKFLFWSIKRYFDGI